MEAKALAARLGTQREPLAAVGTTTESRRIGGRRKTAVGLRT
jgi:hypothetical protein